MKFKYGLLKKQIKKGQLSFRWIIPYCLLIK